MKGNKSEIQNIYDRKEKKFDKIKFFELQRKVYEKFFQNECQVIGEFIIFCILSIEERLMVEPEEALQTILDLESEMQFSSANKKVKDQMNIINSLN